MAYIEQTAEDTLTSKYTHGDYWIQIVNVLFNVPKRNFTFQDKPSFDKDYLKFWWNFFVKQSKIQQVMPCILFQFLSAVKELCFQI